MPMLKPLDHRVEGEGQLAHFIRKGRLRRLDAPLGDCSGCAKCDAFALEVYEWTG